MDRKDTLVRTSQGYAWTYLDVVYVNAYNRLDSEQIRTTTLLETDLVFNFNDQPESGVDFDSTIDNLEQQAKEKGLNLRAIFDLDDTGICKLIYKDQDEYYGIFVSDGEYANEMAIFEKIEIIDWEYLNKVRIEDSWDNYIRDEIRADVDDFWDWYNSYI